MKRGLMKKLLLTAAALAMLSTPLWGAVTGNCVNCHSMHFSQNGQPPLFQGQAVDGPNAGLLLANCVGCHSNTTSSETIYMLGDSRVPSVYNPGNEPTYPSNGSTSSALAGGNFFWVGQAGGDVFGHNVFGIAGLDPNHSVNGAPGGMAALVRRWPLRARPAMTAILPCQLKPKVVKAATWRAGPTTLLVTAALRTGKMAGTVSLATP